MSFAKARLRALYFLFYGAQGVIVPYLPVWFAGRGLGVELIATIISVSFLPKIVSNPVCAHIVDVQHRVKPVLLGLLSLAIFLFAAYFLADGPAGFLMIAVLINALVPSVIPLIDRLAIAQTDGARPLYTTIRVFGSLGFAAMALGAGYVVKSLGADTVVWLIVSLLLLSACMAAAVRDIEGDRPRRHADRRALPIVRLLADRPLLVAICAAALIQASNGFLYSLASIYWLSRGLDTIDIGLLWVVGVGSEIAFFLVAAPFIARIGALNTVVLAGGVTAARWYGMSTSLDIAVLAACQLLQAFTIAANNSAIMTHIAATADELYKTTAIGVYTALATGVFIFVSITIGRHVHAVDPPGGFVVMALFALAAVPLAALARIMGRRHAAVAG